MKQTSKILMMLLVGLIVLALIIVLLFETEVILPGPLAGMNQSEFVWATLMELLTLGAAFMGLRLFKFKRVHDELVSRPESLLKWGVIRLLVLGVPMVVDTLLYYVYMNPTFGYLAIMLLLCLPFVIPTEARCLAETEEEKEADEAVSEDSNEQSELTDSVKDKIDSVKDKIDSVENKADTAEDKKEGSR